MRFFQSHETAIAAKDQKLDKNNEELSPLRGDVALQCKSQSQHFRIEKKILDVSSY